MKQFFFLSFFLILHCTLKAQDPRFAQFYSAPDQLNPALNVVYDGKMRFIANYRDQWSSVLNDVPFRTIAAHLDYRFAVTNNDYIAIGINGFQDEAGLSHLKRLKGYLNFAFMKYLGGSKSKEYYLVAGTQIGMGQHSLNWSDLWFSAQYDAANEVIDYNLPSGEVETRTGRVFPDFNAGLLWYMLTGKNSLYFGGAIYHINSPNISIFDGGNDPLKSRYVGHLGGELAITDYLALLPAAAVYIQGPALDVNIGSNFRYTTGDYNDLALRLGAWAHITRKLDGLSFEALTITTMLEMQKWTLGLSYDINTSQLTPASNARGAFETSFIYILSAGKRKQKVICPKF